MGSLTVLVLGADASNQIAKYQREDYAPHTNPHFVCVDKLDKMKQNYLQAFDSQMLQHSDGSERMSFLAWLKTQMRPTSQILLEGEDPDFHGQAPEFRGRHRNGWYRVNADDDVVEIFERTIPGAEWDWLIGTIPCLKLKPGAVGEFEDSPYVDYYDNQSEDEDEGAEANQMKNLREGYAGIARKSAIDFDAMRDEAGAKAAAEWDAAARARGALTWELLEVIQARRPREEFAEADREYWAQPAVRAMQDARCRWQWRVFDLFSLPREEYIQRRRGGAITAEVPTILKDGKMLEHDEAPEPAAISPNAMTLREGLARGDAWLRKLNAVLDSLPDDALFTAVLVHA